MPLRVEIHNAHFLPDCVDPKLLALGAREVGAMFGLKELDISISRHHSKNFGAMKPTTSKRSKIILYDSVIRKFPNIARLYSFTLAHEIVHVSQLVRGGTKYLPTEMGEMEATRLEDIYGRVIYDKLRGR